MRQKLLLLAAIFFGILAFLFTYQQIKSEKAKIQQSIEEREVIVIQKDLLDGEEIKEEHLQKKKVSRSKDDVISQEVLWKQRDRVIGNTVSNMVPAGTILTWQAIERSRSEMENTGLAGRINRGDTDTSKPYAITIPVDAVSSLNGLVRPYNRVDVIGTFTRPDQADPNLQMVTMTILRNVKVLACGANLSGNSTGRGYNTVTLKVSLEEAEMLVFAQNKGRLTLALRSPEFGSREETMPPPVNWDTFLKAQSASGQKK